jgi:cytochrome P450 PksS
MSSIPTRHDLRSKALHNDAHRVFATLRERDPVHKGSILGRDLYFVTRYDDVEAVLKARDRFVKDPTNTALGPAGRRTLPTPKIVASFMNSMITSDDPQHRRLRRLVSKAFTTKMIRELAPSIEAKTGALCDDIGDQTAVDLIDALALPLPIHVITALVGVPQADHRRFHRWVWQIMRNFTPWNMPLIMHGMACFQRYMGQLADQKRVAPTDDLFTRLVQVEDEGEHLSRDELVAMAFLLLSAGHETTVSLIANGTLALLEHPDLWEHLRDHPEQIPLAVEELLRFDGPTLGTEFHYAKEDTVLRGVDIPAGGAVMPMVISANRDPSVFPNPDTLQIDRNPNPHLAFGKGIHACIGAPLARLEGEIVFKVLTQRFETPELAVPRERIRYRNMLFLHRLDGLPLRLRPRPG